MPAKRIAHVDAVIDLAVKGAQKAQQQLEQIGTIKDKIEKDNRIQYVMEVDQKGLLKIKEIKDELDLKDKNLMNIGVNKDSLQGTKDTVQEFIDWLRKTFESVKYGDIFGGGTSNSSIQKEINAQKGKLEELQKILAEQKKFYKEQEKLVSDTQNKIAKVKPQKNDDLLGKLYDAETILNDVDDEDDKAYGKAIKNFEKAFKTYLISTSESQIKKDMSESGGYLEEIIDIFDTYQNANFYDNDRKLLFGEVLAYKEKLIKKGFGKTKKDTDKENEVKELESVLRQAIEARDAANTRINEIESEIKALQSEIKTVEENAKRASKKQSSDTTKSRGSSNVKDDDKTVTASDDAIQDIEQGGTASIKVKPADLDQFYKDIESHKKANIKVTLDNTEIKKRTKENDVDTIQVKASLNIKESLKTLKGNIEESINPIRIDIDDKNIGNVASTVQNIKDKIVEDSGINGQID